MVKIALGPEEKKIPSHSDHGTVCFKEWLLFAAKLLCHVFPIYSPIKGNSILAFAKYR